MNKHRQRILLIVITVLVSTIILLVALRMHESQNSDYEQVSYLIGMSHANLIEEWQLELQEDIEKQVRQYGPVKLIPTNAGDSSFKQIGDVEKLMEYGIDLLIISVTDAIALSSTLEKVSQEIPVIVMGKDVESNDYALYIGPDYYHIGTLGAKQAEILAKGDSFRIKTVFGSIENDEVTAVNEGFLDGIKGIDNLSVSEQVFIDRLDGAVSTRLANEFKDDTYDAVFVQSTDLLLDVVNIMDQLNIKKPVIVAGKYISDKYLTYMDIGNIKTFIYTPLGGKEAVDYGMKLLTGKKDEQSVPKRVIMDSLIINQDNKEKYVKGKVSTFNRRIGIIECSLFDNQFFSESIKDEWEIVYYEDQTYGDIEEAHHHQELGFSYLMNEQIDMIVFEPVIADRWDKLFQEAVDRGIRVICLGNKPDFNDEEGNLIYIGPDYVDQSQRLAAYLINEVYSTSYDIGILEIADEDRISASDQKSTSLKMQISGYSRINIIDRVETGSRDKQSFEENMKRVFSKYEADINVIYLHNNMIVDRLETVLQKITNKKMYIICSNDIGVDQNNSYIDFQVTTEPLYEEQLNFLLDHFDENGKSYVGEIFLPNTAH